MTPSEAFATVALVAVACDGDLGREEAQALRQQLERRTPYRNTSEAQMAALFDRLLAQLRTEGWRTLLSRALAALNRDQQHTALAMAAHLVHADRVVSAQERQLLEAMAEQLGPDGGRTAQILEVVAILNRDSLAE